MPISNPIQRTLFPDAEVQMPRVVNVASVPHRSPFRYPGGKTWLIPQVRRWLRSRFAKPTVLIEAFAGGAIVGLTVAFEDLASKVILVELDEDVAAVWQTILSDDNRWLRDRILNFDLTEPNVRSIVGQKTRSSRDRAFRTLLKNRTFHGGILAAGSAPIRAGENGKGIRSRWYPATLARRIREIETVRDRIEFIQGDGIAVIKKFAKQKQAAFFIDPPYTAAGKHAGRRLYTHHELDHARLFATAAKVEGDVLMTYDNADDVVTMAMKNGFQTTAIPMKNTHHAVMSELLIGHNLDWVM